MNRPSSFWLRHSFVILASSFVILTAWWLASPENGKHGKKEAIETHLPDSTVIDPLIVFQKAFWKRPTPEDQILHAERREWQDKDGLSKWQWFIAVKPSPALVAHLITDNAFMLSASPSSGERQHAEAPEWFPNEAPQVLANPTGTFRILWDKKANLLHATDSGSGFRPGAPEPIRPLAAANPEGRLPTTPPPKP